MQTEIAIPPQPPETTKFKRGDSVIWCPIHLFSPRVCKVIDHYPFKNSYRIEDSQGEALVTEEDIMSVEEHASAVERYKTEQKTTEEFEARARLSRVIFAWKNGIRTPQELASKYGGPVVKWYKQIQCAKTRGFISE